MLKVYVLSLSLILTNSIFADAFDFNLGYSCRTNGNWTQSALEQTAKLVQTLQAIKEDENCKGKGLESLIAKLTSAELGLGNSSNDQEEMDEANSDANKSFINSVVNSNSKDMNKGGIWDILAKSHISSAISRTSKMAGSLNLLGKFVNPSQLQSGLNKSTNELVEIVNYTMANLPYYQRCLVGAPDQGVAILSAMLRLSSNILNSGYSDGSNMMGNIVSNLVNFLRDNEFSRVLRDLNQTELWASITCALESTTQSYCSAKDNLKLMDWSLKQLQDETKDEMKDTNNPIAGYFTLVRNVPTVTNWLLQVQFGVEPKLGTDANYKNMVWDTVLNIIQATNDLIGAYNESKRNVEGLGEELAKKSEIYKLVIRLQKIMASAVQAYGSTMVNFFTTTMPDDILPMYLIGFDIDNIPQEVKPNDEGRFVMGIPTWIQNGGSYRSMFDDPAKLLLTIKERLDKLIDSALTETSKFFVRRLIIDKPNLVAEAFVFNSLNTSVVDSLNFIEQYLINLGARINKSPYGDKQIIPVIQDTIDKTRKILNVFDSYLTPEKLSDSNVTEQSRKIIEMVYESFNVLRQRDSFLTNRMSTFVFYDYYLQIVEGKTYDEYEQQLMIISNNEMIQRILQVHETEPALNREDFNNAMMINRRNLDSLESIFRNNFFNFLQTTEDDALGMSFTKRNLRSANRLLNTDVPSMFRWSPFVPVLATGNYFLNYKYRYQFYFNHPIQPKYQRGDNDHDSLMKNKNRVCVQLLATQKPEIFKEFCENATIESPFYEASGKLDKYDYLNTRFNDYTNYKDERPWWMKTTNLYYSNKDGIQEKAKTSDEKICAYRDYLRKNHVYWLTLQHNQIKKRKLKEFNLLGKKIVDAAKKKDGENEKQLKNKIVKELTQEKE